MESITATLEEDSFKRRHADIRQLWRMHPTFLSRARIRHEPSSGTQVADSLSPMTPASHGKLEYSTQGSEFATDVHLRW